MQGCVGRSALLRNVACCHNPLFIYYYLAPPFRELECLRLVRLDTAAISYLKLGRGLEVVVFGLVFGCTCLFVSVFFLLLFAG